MFNGRGKIFLFPTLQRYMRCPNANMVNFLLQKKAFIIEKYIGGNTLLTQIGYINTIDRTEPNIMIFRRLSENELMYCKDSNFRHRN